MLTTIITFLSELFTLWGLILASILVGCLLPGLLLLTISAILRFFKAN